MLLTLKRMDRLNAITEFTTSFPSLTLHADYLLLWKKIHSLTVFKIITVSRPRTLLSVSLMRRLGCPTKGEDWRGSSCKPKSLNFPLLLDITPTKNLSPHVGKKVSLIAFKQIDPKIFPVAYIFSNTIMTSLKKLIGNKSLNTKQSPAGLFPELSP